MQILRTPTIKKMRKRISKLNLHIKICQWRAKTVRVGQSKRNLKIRHWIYQFPLKFRHYNEPN